MATRQEIQIALDMIKYVNVPNDMILSGAIPIAKGEIQVTEGIVGAQTKRSMTIKERKENLKRLTTQIMGYKDKLSSFLSVPSQRSAAAVGITALGVTIESIEEDITTIATVANKLDIDAGNAKTDKDLVDIGNALLIDTPALLLIRKS